MNSNSTSDTSGGNQPGIGLDLTSPITVLPFVAALAMVISTFVGGCLVYHRRQRKRTRNLVRRLKVTERRIDGVGTKNTKKQPSDYCPPAGAPPCSSTTFELANGNNTHLILHDEEQSVPNSTAEAYNEEKKTFTITVQLSDHPVADESLETKLETNNETSYYCSTCKVEESESGLDSYLSEGTDQLNSSLAVECATIPAVSSMSTISTNRVTIKQPSKVCNKLRKSKSYLNRNRQSSRFMRALGLRSSKPMQIVLPRQVCTDIEAQKPSQSVCQVNQTESTTGEQIFGSQLSVVKGEYQNPISSKNEGSPVVQSVASSCTTNTEGKLKMEKWV